MKKLIKPLALMAVFGFSMLSMQSAQAWWWPGSGWGGPWGGGPLSLIHI